ncbi:MAG TPA: DUF5694 domain-containing protein [Saprospiraceae bacterium]|nr:DUF5694 domain-containing protein [Saprospiraceae bacterium]HMQ85559.1 DUF5694 domain-containing protein [Saprospiraceae bacterium]
MSFLIFFAQALNAQPHPDSILLGGREVPKVLLVGTFHFGYPNLDAHQVAAEDQLDILSPQKQAEVEELVNYLAQFRPTKIVVEGGRNSGYLMRRYERWKSGESPLRANEIDQLAFRLMDRFQLDTIYGCDAPGLTYDMEHAPDSTVFNKWLDEIFDGYDWQSEDPMDERYSVWYEYDDKLSLKMPLLKYFKYMNSDPVIQRMHGAYLVGDFKMPGDRGADALALYWYSRNLRIFRRIQQIEAQPEDRILVLFGAGHISILQQQFQASPEYQLVPFGKIGDFTKK